MSSHHRELHPENNVNNDVYTPLDKHLHSLNSFDDSTATNKVEQDTFLCNQMNTLQEIADYYNENTMEGVLEGSLLQASSTIPENCLDALIDYTNSPYAHNDYDSGHTSLYSSGLNNGGSNIDYYGHRPSKLDWQLPCQQNYLGLSIPARSDGSESQANTGNFSVSQKAKARYIWQRRLAAASQDPEEQICASSAIHKQQQQQQQQTFLNQLLSPFLSRISNNADVVAVNDVFPTNVEMQSIQAIQGHDTELVDDKRIGIDHTEFASDDDDDAAAAISTIKNTNQMMSPCLSLPHQIEAHGLLDQSRITSWNDSTCTTSSATLTPTEYSTSQKPYIDAPPSSTSSEANLISSYSSNIVAVTSKALSALSEQRDANMQDTRSRPPFILPSSALANRERNSRYRVRGRSVERRPVASAFPSTSISSRDFVPSSTTKRNSSYKDDLSESEFDVFDDEQAARATSSKNHSNSTMGESDDSCSIQKIVASNGTSRYSCPDSNCDKDFSTSGHARRHSRIHSDKVSFTCQYPGCISTFSRKDNRGHHYRARHQSDRRKSTAAHNT